MPKVEFQEANVTVEGDEGKDLRKIAHKSNVQVHGGVNKYINCRGFGLCGSDRIHVDPKDCVTPLTWKEKLHLGDKSKVRLACQVKLVGDAKVSIAPALEYGEEVKGNLQFGAAALFFGGITLFFVVFMLFELVGNPLF